MHILAHQLGFKLKTMDKETLSYESRESKRSYCAHCKKDRKHHCCFDPALDSWIEICLSCEMVEYSDDEIHKRGET